MWDGVKVYSRRVAEAEATMCSCARRSLPFGRIVLSPTMIRTWAMDEPQLCICEKYIIHQLQGAKSSKINVTSHEHVEGTYIHLLV